MTAVLDKPWGFCRWCGEPGVVLTRLFDSQWWACEQHRRVPYSSCETPDDCAGSCRAEIACNS